MFTQKVLYMLQLIYENSLFSYHLSVQKQILNIFLPTVTFYNAITSDMLKDVWPGCE